MLQTYCSLLLRLYFIYGRCSVRCCFLLFQAEDGIRDLVRSRGLGDVYKRQMKMEPGNLFLDWQFYLSFKIVG